METSVLCHRGNFFHPNQIQPKKGLGLSGVQRLLDAQGQRGSCMPYAIEFIFKQVTSTIFSIRLAKFLTTIIIKSDFINIGILLISTLYLIT